MSESKAPIRLTELIAELRRELAEAQAQGQGQSPRLLIEEAEIEVQVVLTREQGTDAGVKFWVFNADLKDKTSDAITQKIKVKLKPRAHSEEEDGDFTIADREAPPRAKPAPKPSKRAALAKRAAGMRAAE